MKQIIAALMVVLSGCAGVSPKTYFHTLKVNDEVCRGATEPALSSELVIGVGPVSLADPLNRLQLVTRDPQGQVRFAEFHRWSGTLTDNIAQVFSDCLARRLGNSSVFAYPWLSGLRPDYKIRMNFERFDGYPGGKVEIRVDWLVVDSSGVPVINVVRTQLTRSATDESIDGLVRALEYLVAELAVTVADRLPDKETETGP